MVQKSEIDRLNHNVMSELQELEQKIQKESTEQKPDKNKIFQLRLEQFYKGLAMNTGIVRNNGYNKFF